MSAKAYKLTAATDEQSGELGIGFEDLNINPELFMVSEDPLQIAHDYCEHVNGLEAIGSIHDELEALGGILFVRGYAGQLRRDGGGGMYSFNEHLASDITRMFGELSYIDFDPINYVNEEDCDINDVVEVARRSIIAEYDRVDITFSSYRQYWQSAITYMQIGYAKAEKRFASQYAAHNLFWFIFEAVEPAFTGIEYEGQQWVLTIDETNGTATCEEFYETDEELYA